MASLVASVRSGIFISHAHEDEDLARCLRELLQSIFGPRFPITCTSDDAYGLQRGAELDDQIRNRLDGANALFLLATAASRQRDWVQFECAYADQARARGEMHFYVLTPTSADIGSVPAPYRERIAVTLSHATDVLAFTKQLRAELGVAADPVDETHTFDALLALHARAAKLERAALEEDVHRLAGERDRLSRHHKWSQASALVLLAALLVSAVVQWRQMTNLRSEHSAELARLNQSHQRELEGKTLEMEKARDTELRSLPFSGFLQDAHNRMVPCVRVTARVFDADGKPRDVVKDCKAGRFTYGVRELGVDPRERFTLAVDVPRNFPDVPDLPVDRSTAYVALLITSGGSR
jgi:TIR domain